MPFLKRIALFYVWILIVTHAFANAAFASDRYTNKIRLDRKHENMIASVQVLDTPPPDGTYDVLQVIRASDVFTQQSDQLKNLIRFEAAKIKATAIIDFKCKVEYRYMKTCSAKAIRVK